MTPKPGYSTEEALPDGDLVEPLGLTHYDAVMALLTASGLPVADLVPEDMHGFLGIHVEGSLVAVGGLQRAGSDGLLRSVATDPGFRGRGYAERIVNALESSALRCGVRSLYLLTETATGYFERRGYRAADRSSAPVDIATTTQFTELCPDSAAFMFRPISRAEEP